MRFTRRRSALLGAAPALAGLTAGCELGGQQAAAPTPSSAPAAAAATPTTAAPELVWTFSNSPPHIVEINAVTNQIVRTKDVPNLGTWATNDDNCYYDGTNVWLGARNPNTSDVEVL